MKWTVVVTFPNIYAKSGREAKREILELIQEGDKASGTEWISEIDVHVEESEGFGNE